jgi:GNAT superfamily N-acetyltransferase
MSDAPPDLRLRALAPSDLAAAHRLSSAFGWPFRIEDWRLLLDLGQGLAAEDLRGHVVATGLRWTYAEAVSTIGMMLVDPAWQRRGIGTRLMAALLDRIATPILLHATAAGEALYAAHGFRPIGRARQHQGLSAGPVASPRVRLAQPSDYDLLHSLDAAAFGASRAPLMTRLTAVGAPYVIETRGRVSGFAIRRAFGRGHLVGPVVAETVADALELTAACLVPGFNRIDIAADDPAVTRALAAHGLADAGAVVPMVRGAWPAAGASPLRFALASQSLG